MGGIGVVVNPEAGGNRRAGDRAQRLGHVVGSAGSVREIPTLADVAEVAAECRDRDIDVLAVCGGDGTYTRVLSALVQAYGDRQLPRFLPLRAGTMNTVARAVGCPAWQPERMLAQVVADYRTGQSVDLMEHQLLGVNGSGFVVGAGVVVGFLRAYYDGPRQGRLGAATLLARLIASAIVRGPLVREVFEWTRARMWCDETLVPFSEFSVIYASSIEDIGLGFRPTYRARERRGYFHVFAGSLQEGELARRLWRIRRGRPTGSRRVHDGLARRLRVDFQQPTPYMIDGEIMKPVSRLLVEAGPVLRIIRR